MSNNSLINFLQWLKENKGKITLESEEMSNGDFFSIRLSTCNTEHTHTHIDFVSLEDLSFQRDPVSNLVYIIERAQHSISSHLDEVKHQPSPKTL